MASSYASTKRVRYRLDRSKPWQAQLWDGGTTRHLGSFATQIEAATAYAVAAEEKQRNGPVRCCEFCGKLLPDRRRKFCSTTCEKRTRADIQRREPARRCEYCDRPLPYSKQRNARFCSTSCGKAAYHGTPLERHQEQRYASTIEGRWHHDRRQEP
jgi:hypothetical protein